MALPAAIRAELLDDSTVAGLVGARIYRKKVPGTPSLPWITVQRIGATRVRHMANASGLVSANYQITCWAVTPDAADVLADAVRLALDHFTGTLGTGSNTVTAGGVFLIGDLELDGTPTDSSEIGPDGVALEFNFWFRETAPTR